LARNFATGVELEEDATQASLRLGSAMTLAGKVTDIKGKAITNAQIEARFRTERLQFSSGYSATVDVKGHFEIKGLLPSWPYTLYVSAKGYGQESRDVEASDTQTNLIMLDPFQLPLANQLIAGIVLDQHDRPVGLAGMCSYGGKQPRSLFATDAKGHFSVHNVCAGRIQISVMTDRGPLGNVTAEAGDTNIIIRISTSPAVQPVAPGRVP
jgi:hypothetical protein